MQLGGALVTQPTRPAQARTYSRLTSSGTLILGPPRSCVCASVAGSCCGNQPDVFPVSPHIGTSVFHCDIHQQRGRFQQEFRRALVFLFFRLFFYPSLLFFPPFLSSLSFFCSYFFPSALLSGIFSSCSFPLLPPFPPPPSLPPVPVPAFFSSPPFLLLCPPPFPLGTARAQEASSANPPGPVPGAELVCLVLGLSHYSCDKH